jgi:hypothetical protein
MTNFRYDGKFGVTDYYIAAHSKIKLQRACHYSSGVDVYGSKKNNRPNRFNVEGRVELTLQGRHMSEERPLFIFFISLLDDLRKPISIRIRPRSINDSL